MILEDGFLLLTTALLLVTHNDFANSQAVPPPPRSSADLSPIIDAMTSSSDDSQAPKATDDDGAKATPQISDGSAPARIDGSPAKIIDGSPDVSPNGNDAAVERALPDVPSGDDPPKATGTADIPVVDRAGADSDINVPFKPYVSNYSYAGCGRVPVYEAASAKNPRVRGGRAALKAKWPFAVALSIGVTNILCGGTIIRPDVIVTAGHCVFDWKPQHKAWIIAGTNDLQVPGASAEFIPAIWPPIIRTGFIPRRLPPINDVALLRLTKSLDINKFKQPACLPANGTIPPYGKNKCYVVGWGATGPALKLPKLLQEAAVPIVPSYKCNWEFGGRVDRKMLCAGTNNIDACQGDSGGPLICTFGNGAEWVLHGIVSWGAQCGKPFPGVYTRVASHTDWIEKELAKMDAKKLKRTKDVS